MAKINSINNASDILNLPLSSSTQGQITIGGNIMLRTASSDKSTIAIGSGAGGTNYSVGNNAVIIGSGAAASGSVYPIDNTVIIGARAGTASIAGGGLNSVVIGAEAGAGSYGYDANTVIIGYQAGNLTLTTAHAIENTATGNTCLISLVGTNANEAICNCAYGYNSGVAVTSGSFNVFYASSSGYTTTTGSNNICIGFQAVTSGATASNELVIGNGTGTGTGNIVKASICGITGKTSTSGAAVYCNSSNVLGTSTSSLRYKEDVTNMSDMSQICASLRPVTFHFKEDTTPKPLQYGLIAEEVEAIWPEMVIYGQDGLPQNLSYNFLAPMLLKEVQKLNTVITDLTARITALEGK